MLPNGDVLAAETSAPERPDDGKGIKGWIMRLAMKRAGADVPSADRISLLRDANGDGNTDGLMRFPYFEGQTEVTAPGEKIADLPAGPINHHWTKSLVASPDGMRLYVGVGSNSNIAENGLD